MVAAIILVAWFAVRLWSSRTADEPSPTVTATVASPAPVTPVVTTPPGDSTTSVSLRGGGGTCSDRKVTITPSVPANQHARHVVAVDLVIRTSADAPCVLKPKAYDPLAVISLDGEPVWDSSVCAASMVAQPVQLTPDWATTVRLPWTPRKSGKDCSGKEDWVDAGTYVLQIGTLGGEPGKTTFILLPPLPPSPSPTPTPTPSPKPSPKPSPTR